MDGDPGQDRSGALVEQAEQEPQEGERDEEDDGRGTQAMDRPERDSGEHRRHPRPAPAGQGREEVAPEEELLGHRGQRGDHGRGGHDAERVVAQAQLLVQVLLLVGPERVGPDEVEDVGAGQDGQDEGSGPANRYSPQAELRRGDAGTPGPGEQDSGRDEGDVLEDRRDQDRPQRRARHACVRDPGYDSHDHAAADQRRQQTGDERHRSAPGRPGAPERDVAVGPARRRRRPGRTSRGRLGRRSGERPGPGVRERISGPGR